MKAQRVIDIARTLPAGTECKLPGRNEVAGPLLDEVSRDGHKASVKDVLKEARIFGCSVMADGATIDGVPLYNIIAAGVNNPMAVLDVADLSESSANGETKSGTKLANLMGPLISTLENAEDPQGNRHLGIVDLCAVDGASNVQVCAVQTLWLLLLISPLLNIYLSFSLLDDGHDIGSTVPTHDIPSRHRARHRPRVQRGVHNGCRIQGTGLPDKESLQRFWFREALT